MHKVLLVLVLALVAVPGGAAAPPRERLDEAIDRALEFLHRNQDRTGCWRDGHQPNAALTGLGVMAFLSAGHVPGEGPYSETVQKGVRWLLDRQQANGLLSTNENLEMYHHGICTLALAEVVGMTDGKLAEEVRRKLQKAVELILVAQRTSGEHRGGWRYRVAYHDADISISGWQLLSLRAAKNLGCDVRSERIDWAVDYIKRCQDPVSGGFNYQPRMPGPAHARTGTGILALEICGKERHHTEEALRAGHFVLKHTPRWGEPHFYYAIYHCSQGMFQLGGNYWDSFRPRLHRVLLDHQEKSGAWVGGDAMDGRYGPNYCTAMAVLALAVEYRYLPIYQRNEEREEKPKR
jgi:hypothetical protein